MEGSACSGFLNHGAGNRDRTGDLKITNLALYQLSYPGLLIPRTTKLGGSTRISTTGAASVLCAPDPRKSLERETGIEPATNSLEGCDSTTELLPPEVSSAILTHWAPLL